MNDLHENLYPEQIQAEVVTVGAKIYTLNQIRVCTFLGGPLIAGYLIAENFKAFNDYARAKQTWITALLATVLIFGLLFVLPENKRIPNVVFPIAYSWLTYMLANYYQGKQIKAYLMANGQTFNWSRAIVVSLIGLVVTFVIIFIGVFAADFISPSE